MLPSLPGRIRRKPAPLARNLPPRWRVIPVAYSACGFWDTGLNACCLGGELKLLLPEDVWRNEPIVFDQSGGVVAIAERSPCACCALDQKRWFLNHATDGWISQRRRMNLTHAILIIDLTDYLADKLGAQAKEARRETFDHTTRP